MSGAEEVTKTYRCSTSRICQGLSGNADNAAHSVARSIYETCKAGLSSLYSALGLPEKVGQGGAKFKTPMSSDNSTGSAPSSGASPDVS